MEQYTLTKRHSKACELAGIEPSPFYTFRHTCLTRWTSHMDPYALAYFAGRSDFGTTRRLRPPEHGRRAGSSGKRPLQNGRVLKAVNLRAGKAWCGTPGRIRTADLLLRRHSIDVYVVHSTVGPGRL